MRFVEMTGAQFMTMSRNPDALTLWRTLQFMHADNPGPFAIRCKAMAATEAIPGWTDWRRYERARDWLLEQGDLVVAGGGQISSEADLFRLSSRAVL